MTTDSVAVIKRSMYYTESERQDRLDKELIDRFHRSNIRVFGSCKACGLPHGSKCQCLTLAEADAGRKAERDHR